MIDGYAAFGQDFLKVSIGDRIAHAKEDGMQDDTLGEMNAFEINRHPLPPHSCVYTNCNILSRSKKFATEPFRVELLACDNPLLSFTHRTSN